MNRLATAVSVFVAAVLIAVPSFAAAKFQPPEGKTILFVGQDIDAIDTYLKDLKIEPAGFMTYTSLDNMTGLKDEYDEGGGRMWAQKLVDEHPNTGLQIGLYLVDQLKSTAAGLYDKHIDDFAAWAKKANRPIFLRIGYEFDNPANHYDPAEYVPAFRHIVDRLRKDGADNVAFVWHSYAQGKMDRIMGWYPGDDYVDWIGASNFGQFPKWIRQIADLADQHGKPFMLCETSSWYVHNEPQRLAFFKRLFTFIDTHKVSALCYIDVDWNELPMWESQHFGDGRVQPYPDVLALWKQETSQDKFLKSSPSLFRQLGFKPRR